MNTVTIFSYLDGILIQSVVYEMRKSKYTVIIGLGRAPALPPTMQIHMEQPPFKPASHSTWDFPTVIIR